MDEEMKTLIPVHRPGTREMLFFCLSGIIVSIPSTLFFSVFSSHLCFFLSIIYSETCTSGIFAPFIEEFFPHMRDVARDDLVFVDLVSAAAALWNHRRQARVNAFTYGQAASGGIAGDADLLRVDVAGCDQEIGGTHHVLKVESPGWRFDPSRGLWYRPRREHASEDTHSSGVHK